MHRLESTVLPFVFFNFSEKNSEIKPIQTFKFYVLFQADIFVAILH